MRVTTLCWPFGSFCLASAGFVLGAWFQRDLASQSMLWPYPGVSAFAGIGLASLGLGGLVVAALRDRLAGRRAEAAALAELSAAVASSDDPADVLRVAVASPARSAQRARRRHRPARA